MTDTSLINDVELIKNSRSRPQPTEGSDPLHNISGGCLQTYCTALGKQTRELACDEELK